MHVAFRFFDLVIRTRTLKFKVIDLSEVHFGAELF